MQLELELKKGFCSSNIQTLETSTLQKSRGSWPLFPDFNKNREDPVASRLPKYPPNCNEAKCFQNSKSATSMLFQQWPGAFNKWGSFKCLPSFQANLYVRSQTTNNQRSSSKNPRLTDSRQKRAQKKYRSGGPLSTRSLFETKNSGSNGLPKQERRGRTHCTCLGSFTSGPAARSPIYPLLKQHGNENPVWPIRNKSLSSEQFVFHCHGNLLEGNT